MTVCRCGTNCAQILDIGHGKPKRQATEWIVTSTSDIGAPGASDSAHFIGRGYKPSNKQQENITDALTTLFRAGSGHAIKTQGWAAYIGRTEEVLSSASSSLLFDQAKWDEYTLAAKGKGRSRTRANYFIQVRVRIGEGMGSGN